MSYNYKCTNKCSSHKIGGKNYVGTPRSRRERIFGLKYCARCKVYYDTPENRCFCCKLPLRNSLRNRYAHTK